MDAGLTCTQSVATALAYYLEWILKESRVRLLFAYCSKNYDRFHTSHYQSEIVSEYRQALTKPLSQIQTWLLQHLACESCNGLDSVDQVDLWPFLTLYADSSRAWKIGLSLSDHVTSALEICGTSRPTIISNQVSCDKDVEPFFLSLLPHIPLWLASADLLDNTQLLRADMEQHSSPLCVFYCDYQKICS